jgi:deaminated glutathione amidase
MIRAAVIQMVSTADVAENLAAAGELLAEAAGAGAGLAVLHENFPCMGVHDTDKVALKEKAGAGPIQTFLHDTARKHGLWIVGGTIPLAADAPGKVRAASLLYDDQGECVARYDKLHLFDVDVGGGESYRESDTLEAGADIVVAETPFARVGLSVCYDVRFPELYRNMQRQGVELITVPSAFTATTGAAHWHALLRARAVENLCYVIAPNQGGMHANNRETYGHSLILDPWGRVLAEIETGPGIACADLDFEYLHALRNRFPALTHRRLDYQLS